MPQHAVPQYAIRFPQRALRAARRATPAFALAWALAWTLLAPPAEAVAQLLTVELRPQVTAGQARVQLADVAVLEGADQALLRKLGQLPLGAAPAAGASVELTRHDIERWIRAYAGWPAGQIEWRGSAVTRLHGAAADGALASQVLPLARQALLDWLAQWSAQASAVAAPDQATSLPPGALELRVRPFSAGQLPARQMWVWVEAWQGPQLVRVLPLRFEVSAPAPALLARHALAAGSRPQAGDFDAGEIDLANVAHPLAKARHAELWAALEQGVRLRRALPAGSALDAANSEPSPAVCSGDTVRLSLTSGPVALASPARALQDGQLGQKVAVLASGSTHSIMARVTGAGTVEVE